MQTLLKEKTAKQVAMAADYEIGCSKI